MRRSASIGWPRVDKRDAGGRMRVLSGPTHFGPNSEAEMGAHGHDRTALSVWVGPLGCHFPIFPIRADTFGRGVVVWVGLLEMPFTLPPAVSVIWPSSSASSAVATSAKLT
jgi:hypothetical protein